MKSRIIWILASSLLTLSLVLASCGGEEEEPTEEPTVQPTEKPTEEPVTEEPVTPGGGNWWDAWGEPEYGGTLTFQSSRDVSNWDHYFRPNNFALYLETMGIYDFTLDRDIWDFKGAYIPDEYITGLLAESWECTDFQTVTLNIRKGINWQNKPPMNGRELTADDIAHHYHRFLGIGGGYEEGSPYYSGAVYFKGLESATVIDKYTLVFKWAQPSRMAVSALIDPAFQNPIEAPEAVELYGDLQDWENAVGTGPWMLDDYVSASSITYSKNPNYWRYDERYPQNKLPYADHIKILIIPDAATARSALRTGKIDQLRGVNWEQALNISEQNPELILTRIPAGGGALAFRNDNEPFTDIRVRKALQMSIDRETIAKTYYGGTASDKPMGLSSVKGWYIPYDEWSDDLQEEYSYNPERAKELLTEAGYPNGFKTNLVCSSSGSLDLYEIIQSYLEDIGVEMEINVMEPTVYMSYTRAGKNDQMAIAVWHGASGPLFVDIGRALSTNPTNVSHNDDPVYDDMIRQYDAMIDPEEAREWHIKCDMYAIEHHWALHIVPTASFIISQPWLKGYAGDVMNWNHGAYYSRFWIDHELKESMLH